MAILGRGAVKDIHNLLADGIGKLARTPAVVEQSEQDTDLQVAETVGDCAFGDGETRRQFAEAERKIIAPVPSPPRSITLHPYERQMQRARRYQGTEGFRDAKRNRQGGELETGNWKA